MAPHKTPPAFLFYAADWLADAEVRSMSLAARGALIDMLAFAWREGSVPADPAVLSRLLGTTQAEFEAVWEEVRPRWSDTTGGRLLNPRLEEERAKLRKQHQRLSKAGRKGAAKRWEQQELDGTAMPEEETVDEDFERFWSAYPKRSGGNPKRAAEVKWRSTLKRKEADAPALIEAAERYAAYCTATKRTGSEFVMQAQTFLGPNERWKDRWDLPSTSQERSKTDLRKVKW